MPAENPVHDLGRAHRERKCARTEPAVCSRTQHPNKTRFEIKTQNQISLHVYDGTRGWKMRPTSSGKPELQPYSRRN